MAEMWWWVPAGALLGVAFVQWAPPSQWTRSRRRLAAGLVVAAAVYVALGALAGEAVDILRAAAGVAIFSLFAGLGVRLRPFWLAAGWALHVVWDGALHWTVPEVAPGWYAFLCFGFDPVVAGAILAALPPGARSAGEPTSEASP